MRRLALPLSELLLLAATLGAQIDPPLPSDTPETEKPAAKDPALVEHLTQSVHVAELADSILDGTASAPADSLGPSTAEADESQRSFVVVPMPVSNPTIGTGLRLLAAYFFQADKSDPEVPSSFVGMTAMATDNETWAALVGTKLHLFGDRLRVTGGGGLFDLRYDYFTQGSESIDEGIRVPIRQEGDALAAEVLGHLGRSFYGGLSFLDSQLQTSLDLGSAVGGRIPEVPDQDLDVHLRSYGVKFQRDTRDNQFYPLSGALGELHGRFQDPSIGSDYRFQSYGLSYNHYASVREDRDVLALRGNVCDVRGEAPFFSECSFGTGADLRGYTGGRFRDAASFAVQAEYRLSVSARWKTVFFAGVGNVSSELSTLDLEDPLPSGGLGLRFLLSKKQKLNLRLDYAWGKGESAGYLGVGEAF